MNTTTILKTRFTNDNNITQNTTLILKTHLKHNISENMTCAQLVCHGVTSLPGRRGALHPHGSVLVQHWQSSPAAGGNSRAAAGRGLVGAAGRIMSGRKPRSVANPLESAITTPSERILKECHSLYVDTENGK